MEPHAVQIAEAGLKIKAIQVNPENPFRWASGYTMPVYNDNRLFFFFPEYRKLITDAFAEMVNGMRFDLIAGTATAGISPGILLAERLKMPFVYVRGTTKDHGMQQQVEGLPKGYGLSGKAVLVVEDLISTGGSSLLAIEALRSAGATANTCVCIFHYGLEKANEAFSSSSCTTRPLLTYGELLDVVRRNAFFDDAQLESLRAWSTNPYGWGQQRGFPKHG